MVGTCVEVEGAQNEGSPSLTGAGPAPTLEEMISGHEFHREPMTPTTTSATHPAGPLAGLRVLVIDDNPSVLDVIGAILTAAGALADYSVSALGAVRRLHSFRPDVVLCDILMPSHDGFELLTLMRAHGYRGPAVAFSGMAHDGLRRRAESSGYTACLPKPIEPTRLVSAVLAAAAL